MTVRPFMALLPKPTQINDEIIIKGKIKDDAELFSVNFTLECNPTPQNIAYHFKTVFSENKVVHNYKTVGNWHNEVEDANTWIQNTGQSFVLTFTFCENEILVYTEDENRCYQYAFGHKFNIGDIRSVQLWDDIDYVEEIIFRYKNH